MRLNEQISAWLRRVATAALILGVFASDRQVFASEQAPAMRQQTAQPAPQPAGPLLKVTAEEAVRMALENNLGIQAERIGPQIQTYGVAQARAVFRPNLFSNTTTRSSTSPPDFFASGGFAEATTAERLQTNVGLQQQLGWGGARYSVSLDALRATTTGTQQFNPQLGSTLAASYVQPLLRNFRIDNFRQQVLVSQKNLEIADIQLRQQITVTTRAVKSAYYDLVGAIAGLQVARQSLDLALESLRNNRTRVEVGTMAPIDILEAEAEVSSNEEAVINAESRIKTAEDRLRALIMNPAQQDFWTVRLEPAEQPTLTPAAIDVEAAVANALANRTDIAQTRKRIETTQINLDYLSNQKLPAVDLIANYNTVGVGGTQFIFAPGQFPPVVDREVQRSFGDALRDVFGNQFKTWSVQLQVSYPIGTSPAEAGFAATRLQREQERTTLRDQEMQIATAVRDAGRQVTTNLKRVEATRKAREFAERRLEAEQKRFTVGLSTTFQLFQAQRDLARQRQNELNAIIDYNRSLVDFEAIQVAPVGGR
jgi:outer membrane protein